ncbi:chemotaxis protein CheX [Niveispirillum sp.]|uniref:chemotaxis protein CheX n=1 Tax=Niveispirillum sp. TaxID=1917217 RepID=UPI001B71C214|nr:chemotaxis protein CheX [Niveispirillum sp.]MBP7339301.1 chemotaxis protein CheX [Niveispirillum sp.]
MTTSFPELGEIERDALTEIVNIGVGRAARRLADMIGETVQLSVPRVELLTRDVAANLLDQRGSTGLVSVGQDFQGAFSGQALLLFPETNSLELVRAVVGEGMALDEIIALEQGALAEIGNIILNGCLVSIANLLRLDLTMSLPRVLRGSGRTILAVENGEPEPALFLTIDFSVASRNINGYIALLMDLPSLSVLRQLIDEFIATIVQGEKP